MKFRQISLKSAFIYPLMVVFSVAITFISYLQQNSFEEMVKQVSLNQLDAYNQNVHDHLSIYLEEPFKAIESLSNGIAFNRLNASGDVEEIRQFIKSTIHQLYTKVEHLDVIGYGDENGHFVAYRRTQDKNLFSLLLKDQESGNLSIYGTSEPSEQLISVIPNYDPRIRPWYEPVATRQKSTWSEIYPNADELQDTTLSAVTPVYLDDKFHGVMAADIKINTFNEFLIEMRERHKTHIFIYDKFNRLVAHSEDASVLENPDQSNSSGQRLSIDENLSPISKRVGQEILQHNLAAAHSHEYKHHYFTTEIDGERHFSEVMPFIDSRGIDWSIVTTVSESTLLGEVISQRSSHDKLALGITLLCLVSILYILSKITDSITATASAAKKLALGDWQTPLPNPGRIYETSLLIRTFKDMAVNLEYSFKAIHDQLMYDSLTGLLSRQGLIDSIQRDANAQSGSIFHVGINQFRTVNDSLGHETGDRLLTILSERFKSMTSEQSLISRVGGDEFAIYCPSILSVTEAEAFTRNLKEQITSPIRIGNDRVVLDVCIGIVSPINDYDATTSLRNASIALSYAKQELSGISIYEEEMAKASIKRTKTLAKIRKAIEKEEFVPFYQPIIDLETDEIIGAEALARWVSPTEGIIPPFKFIPLAEESGLINTIGSQILFQSCRDGHQALTSGLWQKGFHLHVNTSVAQLNQPTFIDDVIRILAETHFPANQLTLEVTESRIIDENPIVLENLKQLNNLEINIAIDDFGTGYSSLAYLDKLPFNSIKIDRSFINKLTAENVDNSIVAAIVNMTKSFNVDLVAEGIETEEQARLLKGLNCQSAQGFLYSRPIPIEEWSKDLLKT